MAIRYAVATGNWNNVAIWDGGATLPTAGDTVYSNTFVVTINQDILVDKITNNICPTTGLSGGSFSVTTSVIAMCEVESYNQTCLNATGNNFNFTTGRLITGNAPVVDIKNNSNNTLIEFTTIGDPVSSLTANTIEITGNITTNRNSNVYIIGNGTSTVSSQIVKVISGSRLMILGVTGTFISGGQPCFDTPITAFNGAGSFKASATASVIVGAATCLGNISGTLENVNSRMAVVFNSMYLSPTTSLTWKFYNSNDVEKSLYTEDAFDAPIEADVRDNITYANGYKTGTLKVPAPSLVVKDVPTDDTVGSWAFDSDLIARLENNVTENYLITQLGNLTI